jgi:hypothetical protein
LSQQPLDQIPVPVLLAIFVGVILVVYEAGYRLGAWAKERDPDADDGPIGLIVGSILGLMAFLLAITMGMAADRFDTRRGLVLAEANAIGTAYLRAGYLAEPASTDSRTLLTEYVPHRIASGDQARVAADIEVSEGIQSELWGIAEEVARSDGSAVVAAYIESLNEVIDLHTERVVAGIYARVPPTVLWLLIGGIFVSLGLVGYNAGRAGRRSPVIAVVLVVALGAVLWLVVDLDRPQDGLITTSQQPLIDLQETLESAP